MLGSPESFIPGNLVNFMKWVNVPIGREKFPGPAVFYPHVLLPEPMKAGYSDWQLKNTTTLGKEIIYSLVYSHKNFGKKNSSKYIKKIFLIC